MSLDVNLLYAQIHRIGMANQILEAKEKERQKEAEVAVTAKLKEEEAKTNKRRQWVPLPNNTSSQLILAKFFVNLLCFRFRIRL